MPKIPIRLCRFDFFALIYYNTVFYRLCRCIELLLRESICLRNFRSHKLLKLEFFITLIILTVSIVFSIENRDYFVENALEHHYQNLSKFSHLHSYLQEKKVTVKDLKYTVVMLEKLNKPGFILQDDVRLDIARAYQRMGENSLSIKLLQDIIRDSGDSLSTADAVLQLAQEWADQKKTIKAVSLLEKHQGLFQNYRRSEMRFALARLYYQVGDSKNSGKNMVQVDTLDSRYHYLYIEIIADNWKYFDQEQQYTVVRTLSRLNLFQTYAKYASLFISQNKPPVEQVQDITLDLVFHSYKSYVTDFVASLKDIPEYESVYKEMMELHTLSHNEIDTQSARVQGQYYYRKLSYLRKTSTYSATQALSYYNSYLKGAIEPQHAALNLELAIRNMLAFKQYASITNIVERTYQKLGLSNQNGMLTDNVSFWNAYAHLILGNTNQAFTEFENAISEQPDSYFAIHGKEYVNALLKARNLTRMEYISHLHQRLRHLSKDRAKLPVMKLIYAFEDSIGKDKMRQEIIELSQAAFSKNILFEFDDTVLREMSLDKNYIRFIAYTRFGMTDKARAVLTSSGINDPRIQEVLFLKELIRNKQFKKAHSLLVSLKQNKYLNDNFSFLSHELRSMYYPRPYDAEINMALAKLAENNKIDINLVYAIIRGESMYMPRARSYVGAKGLMQLMPATARLVAKAVFGTSTDIDLYNPQNNIILGSYYLNDNVSTMGLLTAIATYNGGYAVIKKVKKQFKPANELELMEIHPYKETRLYVKKILSNYYRYQELYEKQDVTVQMEKLRVNKV